MTIERPDLSNVDPTIRAYIEALEEKLNQTQKQSRPAKAEIQDEPIFEPNEPETTLNVITMSQNGLIKRTPRHHYNRQQRGGMGVFDLDVSENDPPRFLQVADLEQTLLLITTQARAFHLAVQSLPELPIRGRGRAISELLPLRPNEQPALLLDYPGQGYLNIVSDQGQIRRMRYHIVKTTIEPGKVLFDPQDVGQPVAACWSGGEQDLLIATQRGRAIRFDEQHVSFRGCLGIRLAEEDKVIGVTAVTDKYKVFLLGADGKGIIRAMSSFNANKAPGSGGKTALKTNHLVTALTIDPAQDDLFIISRLSKIIRFHAAELSTTEGVVQGINCMTLRADEVMAAINSPQKV